MIHIIDKRNCCGCGACASVCPQKCIEMRPDGEGFLYPVADAAACIECGLCEKTCHELNPFGERTPLQYLAAINNDEAVRLRSSSGGIFHLLAAKTIAEGGVVFGARFDGDWQVVMDYAETMDSVEAFMGSKYVQARTETSYTDACRFLNQGRKVLFSGTPCQIAGLKHFLRKPYDNLLTVDIICHGTPSPKVWSRYLDEVMTSGRKAITDICFRNKRNGWKRFNFALTCNSEDETVSLVSHHKQNHYMRAFLRDMILRPSCHDCKAKCGRSHSDITLADFWGVETEIPQMFDDKGTGLVMLNSPKAMDALDWSIITYAETNAESALRRNPAWSTSPAAHPKRDYFFSQMDRSRSLIPLVEKCLRPPLKKRWEMFIDSLKMSVKRAIGYNRGQSSVEEDPGVEIRQPLPQVTDIKSLTFRNKEKGWKNYRMEIRMK